MVADAMLLMLLIDEVLLNAPLTAIGGTRCVDGLCRAGCAGSRVPKNGCCTTVAP